jgi:hypothetical protein
MQTQPEENAIAIGVAHLKMNLKSLKLASCGYRIRLIHLVLGMELRGRG